MRIFYMFWFFFCSGWGYLVATFPAEAAPPLSQSLVPFPVAMAMAMAFTWWESRGIKSRKLPAPSLRLKPWDLPIGLMVFIGLTFTFTGIWGVALAIGFGLSSPTQALYFLALGLGFAIGCYTASRLMPDRFTNTAARSG
ncbi:hypothetical protein AZ34_03890 [Hylemonella gracilis str. Niagara R]|uniref:Uncharacterized protein n=1 Tax=Hylemonella gracilis str. Niagara R TaxID=1458275 RepID=A0A016XMH5_9BURK|nr:hypothetical protein [Hylemonella gracilis]EYC52782.1 hypothetical protein AZ34_03890 [Hylemonella gracilis str. Niagara R]